MDDRDDRAGHDGSPTGGHTEDGDRPAGRAARREAGMEELRRLDRALEGGQGGYDIVAIILGGVLVAVLIWSIIYGWGWWVAVLCALALVALVLGARRGRPPVAPLELTASERERVRRVLREHGVRPAVALVRALYPGEPTSAAVKTVRLIADRGDADGA